MAPQRSGSAPISCPDHTRLADPTATPRPDLRRLASLARLVVAHVLTQEQQAIALASQATDQQVMDSRRAGT
jgi:hypothetical protein